MCSDVLGSGSAQNPVVLSTSTWLGVVVACFSSGDELPCVPTVDPLGSAMAPNQRTPASENHLL